MGKANVCDFYVCIMHFNYYKHNECNNNSENGNQGQVDMRNMCVSVSKIVK